MRHSRKATRIVAAVAAIMLLGITAYAASVLNLFSFQSGDRFVTVRSNEGMTEQQARELASEPVDYPDDLFVQDLPYRSFDSVEQAAFELGINIILPSAMPEMTLTDATGLVSEFGEGAQLRTVWLNYSDDAGRMFGVTIARMVTTPGVPFTSFSSSDIDDGSLGSYKSASGVEFTTLAESDETGERTAHIAVVMFDEYEFALGFFGFDEAERQQIIDSADLSAYA